MSRHNSPWKIHLAVMLVGFQPLGTADFLNGGSFPFSCGTPQKTCGEKRRCSSCFVTKVYKSQSHLRFPCKIHCCNMTNRKRPCHAILTNFKLSLWTPGQIFKKPSDSEIEITWSIEWATWFLLQRLGLDPTGWNNHRPLGSAVIQCSWLENPRIWSTTSRAL